MYIDIVDYTPDQFSRLTDSQRVKIYEAQAKHNRIKEKMQAALRAERDKLIKNGIFHSGIWEKFKEYTENVYGEELKAVKERLLYDIAHDRMAEDTTNVPYTIDYTLTYDERYIIVRDYYTTAYADALTGYFAFLEDEFAVGYLGDLYTTLHDYLYVLSHP